MESEGGALIYAEAGTRLDISVEKGLLQDRVHRGENEHFDAAVLDDVLIPWGVVWQGVGQEVRLKSRAASALLKAPNTATGDEGNTSAVQQEDLPGEAAEGVPL